MCLSIYSIKIYFLVLSHIWNAVKYAITVVIKKEVLYVLPFGPSAYLAGVIFINRSNSRSAYKELQETKELIISQKVCITIHIYKYINVLKYWDTILGSQHVLNFVTIFRNVWLWKQRFHYVQAKRFNRFLYNAIIWP